MRRSLAIVTFLFAGFVCAHPTAADPAEDFYKGRQIRFIVGFPKGTDYDNWARLIARHWGSFLPGHPNLTVEDMPGAGEIAATNYLYNVASRDGTVVLMTERTLPYLSLTGAPNIRFDPTKFNWIGSPEQSNRVCVAIAGAKVQNAADLFEYELVVGGDGAGTSVTNTPILLSKLLGMKFNLIEGYSSAEHIVIAMRHGELQGICQTLAGLRSAWPGWIERGRLKVLFSLEHDPVPGLNAPTIYQFTDSAEQSQIIDLYDSSLELGRPIIAPPGVPADRVEALRRSFDAMMDDPAFKDDAENSRFMLTLRKGEVLQDFVDQLMATPKDLVTKAKAMTQ
ncbi:MAG TPA: tripartite tricarboxylate transporter substrate-binding protein [Beijerinckiaceae bacterium]|jgi:tripartite-type tricarboxylate transporter receptor subunit TctC|nr:tripartite tricarboxylate transporter substrate-binding protein [Beijerinckiaceae bacterium]